MELNDIQKRIKKAVDREKELGAEIKKLAERVNAQALFVLIAAPLCYFPMGVNPDPGGYPGLVKVEILAYYLFEYFGVSDISPEISDVENCANLLEELSKCRSIISTFGNFAKSKKDDDEIIRSVVSWHEVVRGDSYPHQKASQIKNICGRFDAWFQSNIGITASKSVDIIFCIVEIIQDKYTNIYNCISEELREYESKNNIDKEQYSIDSVLLQKMYKLVGLGLTVKLEEIQKRLDVSQEEFTSLISLIGVDNQTVGNINTVQGMKCYPLYVFADETVMVFDMSNSFDQLWNVLDTKATSDERFRERFIKHRSGWLEERVYDCLDRIFPSKNIYKDVVYDTPWEAEGATAQMDCLIV